MRHPLTVIVASVALLGCKSRTTTEDKPAPKATEAPAAPAPTKPAEPSPKPAEVSEGEERAQATRASLVGRRAPAVTLPVLDGTTANLADVLGKKPVYLKFWATWCQPCREQMPHLEAAFKKYGDKVAFYAIDLGVNDPIETVREFRAEQKLTVPFAIDADGSLAERLEVVVTPMHILIDRAGVVRYVGHEANAELDAALEGLLDDTHAAAADPAPRSEPTHELSSLTLRGGSTFALTPGKPVALSFVLTWCDGYLAKSRPAMSKACIAHEHQVAELRKSHPDVTWVLVAHPVWTVAADLDDFSKPFGDDVKIGIDRDAIWFKHFGVRDAPVTILLDSRGKEAARVTGNGDKLAAALERLR